MMSVGASLAAFLAGATVSVSTSWLLVTRVERLGEWLGLSEALLGLLAALAADQANIAAAVTAIAHQQRALGSGVVIGSNIFNLAALLGVGAVVAGRIGLHRKVVALSGTVALWVAAVCLITVMRVVDSAAALALVLIVLVPYAIVLGMHRAGRRRLPLPRRWSSWLASAVDEEEMELVVAIRPRRGTATDLVVAVPALFVVILATVFMERGASALGQHYAVPGVVVGGLVLAAVTSLPPAVAAVHLAAMGRGAAALSTAFTSNTLNVAAGLLIPTLFVALVRPSGQDLLVAGWYLGLTALTVGLAYAERGLSRWSGWILIAGYSAFVVAVLAGA
jgi:cation:H+ antiporter